MFHLLALARRFMHQRDKCKNWRDSSSDEVALSRRFVSRLSLPLNSWEIHAKRGRAESYQR
jgi:hypothetical protein